MKQLLLTVEEYKKKYIIVRSKNNEIIKKYERELKKLGGKYISFLLKNSDIFEVHQSGWVFPIKNKTIVQNYVENINNKVYFNKLDINREICQKFNFNDINSDRPNKKRKVCSSDKDDKDEKNDKDEKINSINWWKIYSLSLTATLFIFFTSSTYTQFISPNFSCFTFLRLLNSTRTYTQNFQNLSGNFWGNISRVFNKFTNIY